MAFGPSAVEHNSARQEVSNSSHLSKSKRESARQSWGISTQFNKRTLNWSAIVTLKCRRRLPISLPSICATGLGTMVGSTAFPFTHSSKNRQESSDILGFLFGATTAALSGWGLFTHASNLIGQPVAWSDIDFISPPDAAIGRRYPTISTYRVFLDRSLCPTRRNALMNRNGCTFFRADLMPATRRTETTMLD